MKCDLTTLRGLALIAGVATGLAFSGYRAQAQELPAATIAKAKEFKAADNQFIKVLCDGPKAERGEAKATRERLQDELGKAIGDSVAQSPTVQKALDIAADAGEASNRIAASTDASAQAKADAKAKFEKTRDELREIAAKERDRIETQLGKDYGVKLAARELCPDEASSTEKPAKTKVAKKRRSRSNAAAEGGQGAAPAGSASFSFGGGGGGGVGISIGR